MAHLAAAGLTKLSLLGYRMYLHYTAPEVLNRWWVVSKEADVFSFAMVMVEARRGCLPWTDCPLISSSLPT